MNDSPRRIEFIDHLRGAAILSVFLFHALGAAYGYNALGMGWLARNFSFPASFIVLLPVHFGWIGVPIFFVVSGFCIHLAFHRHGDGWKCFFIRRFFRIYPAYFAALVLFCLINRPMEKPWLQFISHALLLHNYDVETILGVNGAFWTLALEAQLYLLYPLLLLLVARLGWKRTLILLAAVEGFLRGWDMLFQVAFFFFGKSFPFVFLKTSALIDRYLTDSPLEYWFSWSLGALAADAFLKRRPLPCPNISVGFLVFMVFASYFLSFLWPFAFSISAVLTFSILGRFFSDSTPKAGAWIPWLNRLRQVGIYSYSIYLIHEPLLKMAAAFILHLWPGTSRFLLFFVCVALWYAILPLAILWYRLIERPGITMGKRLARAWAGETTPVLATSSKPKEPETLAE